MIKETNTPSIKRQLDAANDAAAGLDNGRGGRNERLRGLFTPNQKAAALGLAVLVAVGAAGAIENNIDKDRTFAPVTAENGGQAPEQITPSQISTHETAPATTMVTVGEGQGPYQVVSDAVNEGIVSPEDAPAVQVNVEAQYESAPDGVLHPHAPVSVQVSK